MSNSRERQTSRRFHGQPSSSSQRQKVGPCPCIPDTPYSATIRVDLTTRLMELFKRRGEIEAQIIGRSDALEQAYFAANSELREVLKGKLDDINNGLQQEPETIQSDNVQS